MFNYELTLVLEGKTSSSKQKSFITKIDKLIKTLKGEIVEMDNWGERELVYSIKKSTSGVFIHYKLKLTHDIIKQLNEALRRDEEIIRFLLVREGE